MEGASRTALAAAREQLERVLPDADVVALSGDLTLIGRTLDSSASLRRAVADPSRDAEAKQQLAQRLFGSHVGESASSVLAAAVGQRWTTERDLADALDLLTADTVLAGAEKADRLDTVEDELFRLGRIVSGDPDLRDALADRQRSGDDKAALVRRLLEGKATPETVTLASLAAENPRGQRFDRALERYSKVAAARREQLTALVTVASAIGPELEQRLAQALSNQYGKKIHLNVVVDPEVVGGMRVQIGDDVIDGTVSRRLDDARRAMAG